MPYDTWESHFYPETYNPATGQGTLHNLFGERDAAALSLLELGMSRFFGLRVKMCVWLGVSRGLDLAFLNAD